MSDEHALDDARPAWWDDAAASVVGPRLADELARHDLGLLAVLEMRLPGPEGCRCRQLAARYMGLPDGQPPETDAAEHPAAGAVLEACRLALADMDRLWADARRELDLLEGWCEEEGVPGPAEDPGWAQLWRDSVADGSHPALALRALRRALADAMSSVRAGQPELVVLDDEHQRVVRTPKDVRDLARELLAAGR